MPNPYDFLSIRVADCKAALKLWSKTHRREYEAAMRSLKLGPEYGLSGC